MSGSIPACAGEPERGLTLGDVERVYPRVCGGTFQPLSAVPQAKGLSPRVRGNRRRTGLSRGSEGSIPACAGEPHCGEPLRFPKGVYPRVCGGTHCSHSSHSSGSGLSPRVRGNPARGRGGRRRPGSIPACAGEPPRHRLRPHPPPPGSIPACAGEPPRPRTRHPPAAVYPRVCGGTPSAGVYLWARAGLSPRVRGNPIGCVADGGAERSIPACAGEPP